MIAAYRIVEDLVKERMTENLAKKRTSKSYR